MQLGFPIVYFNSFLRRLGQSYVEIFVLYTKMKKSNIFLSLSFLFSFVMLELLGAAQQNLIQWEED